MSVLRGGSLFLTLVLTTLLLAPAVAASEEPPSAPRDVTGETTADGKFLLTWQPPAEGEVDGYRIYENGELVADVDVESYLATPQAAAAYSVTAYNAYGESMWSAPVVNHNNCLGIGIPPIVQPNGCKQMAEDQVLWLLWFLNEILP